MMPTAIGLPNTLDNRSPARVTEQVDVAGLQPAAARRTGSIPVPRTLAARPDPRLVLLRGLVDLGRRPGACERRCARCAATASESSKAGHRSQPAAGPWLPRLRRRRPHESALQPVLFLISRPSLAGRRRRWEGRGDAIAPG